MRTSSARPSGTGEPIVARSRTNWVSGWFLAVGLLALMGATDPLHLYTTWSDVPAAEPWWVRLPYYGSVAALGLGSFAIFGRPRVEVTTEMVVLRKIVRDVTIPLGAVEKAESDGKYLVITAGGRRYRAAGTESWNVQPFGGASAAAASTVRAAADGTTNTGPVTVVMRRPERAELLLAAAWAAYPLMAFAADLAGLQPA